VVPIDFKLSENIMIHMGTAAAASAAIAATAPVAVDPHGARRNLDSAGTAYAVAAAAAYAATGPTYTAAANIVYADNNQSKHHTYNAECHANSAAYAAEVCKPLLL
jgi:hypothetical protein